MIDYSTLNEPQRQAVMTTEGPLLVLAGAGSGKTRVLTYRIAHLVEDLGVAPWEILAITFTNKAAAEMRERLGDLVGPCARGMWVSTFHSMCVRILRANAHLLGFTEHFTSYDEDDSKRLIKSIMEELDIDTKRIPVNTVRNRISTAKNELILPEEFELTVHDPVGRFAARVYVAMQQCLKAVIDFRPCFLQHFPDDLIISRGLPVSAGPAVVPEEIDNGPWVEYLRTSELISVIPVTKLIVTVIRIVVGSHGTDFIRCKTKIGTVFFIQY